MRPAPASLSRASTIGWIGLGAMGHPMALNLFTKTFLAHQQSSSKDEIPSFLICENDDRRALAFLEDLRQKGGSELANVVERVGSGRDIAMSASRILTMLPSTPQVESVYLDPRAGILAGLKDLTGDTEPLKTPSTKTTTSTSGSAHAPASAEVAEKSMMRNVVDSITGTGTENPPHTILIDQTTLDPTFAMSLAEKIQSETLGRALMLDAPVSGGTTAAASGGLTIMFGSPSDLASSHAVPLLQRMAREGGVIPCGRNGTGVGVKVCNNLILAVNQIALAEGVALGKSLGIDPVLLHSVINSSSGQSWSSRVNSPSPEVPNSPGERGYTGGFQSRLMLKDVGLALTAAHTYDLPTPLTWAAKSVYESVCQEDGGEMATQDFRYVFQAPKEKGMWANGSVVFEWLKRKQAQGVERGWKDGPPGV